MVQVTNNGCKLALDEELLLLTDQKQDKQNKSKTSEQLQWIQQEDPIKLKNLKWFWLVN